MNAAAILRRNPTTATRVREILGLPNDAWDNLNVAFGHGEIATATVTLLLTRAQIVALAELLHEVES